MDAPKPREIFAKMMAEIDALPPEQRVDAMGRMMVCLMDILPLNEVKDLRAKLAARRESNPMPCPECGCGGSALDLVDGHIALRELRGEGTVI